jgi:hypothetical protein
MPADPLLPLAPPPPPPLSLYGGVWLARRGCVCCPCEASPPWHPSWTTLPLSESRTNLMGSPVCMTHLCVGSTFALAPRILGPLHECSTAYCAACLICLLNPQPLSLRAAFFTPGPTYGERTLRTRRPTPPPCPRRSTRPSTPSRSCSSCGRCGRRRRCLRCGSLYCSSLGLRSRSRLLSTWR